MRARAPFNWTVLVVVVSPVVWAVKSCRSGETYFGGSGGVTTRLAGGGGGRGTLLRGSRRRRFWWRFLRLRSSRCRRQADGHGDQTSAKAKHGPLLKRRREPRSLLYSGDHGYTLNCDESSPGSEGTENMSGRWARLLDLLPHAVRMRHRRAAVGGRNDDEPTPRKPGVDMAVFCQLSNPVSPQRRQVPDDPAPARAGFVGKMEERFGYHSARTTVASASSPPAFTP